MAYMDNAGLYRKYGTEKTAVNKAGSYQMPGPNRMIEIKSLDLTTLTTSSLIVSDVEFYPKGWIVERVEVWVKTAATTGTSATLQIGTIETDRSSNPLVGSILTAQAATTIDADGEYNNFTRTAVGVYGDKDTVPTVTQYITASTGTGTFTAGVVDVRIHLRPLV